MQLLWKKPRNNAIKPNEQKWNYYLSLIYVHIVMLLLITLQTVITVRGSIKTPSENGFLIVDLGVFCGHRIYVADPIWAWKFPNVDRELSISLRGNFQIFTEKYLYFYREISVPLHRNFRTSTEKFPYLSEEFLLPLCRNFRISAEKFSKSLRRNFYIFMEKFPYLYNEIYKSLQRNFHISTEKFPYLYGEIVIPLRRKFPYLYGKVSISLWRNFADESRCVLFTSFAFWPVHFHVCDKT